MEIRTARKWYWWLWLSPFLTVPSLVLLSLYEPGYELVCGGNYRGCNYSMAERVTLLIAVLGSSMWHLLLLIPTLNKDSEFVRWHGRQALMLAGVRTSVPIIFGLAYGLDFETLWFIPVLIAIWFFGTLWAQSQAGRGDCSLMRWFGRAEALAFLKTDAELTKAIQRDPETLVDIIRHSHDPEERRQAVQDIDERGLSEPL